MKFTNYPKAYKRNSQTKLLWLYKVGIISRMQWITAKSKIN